MPTSDNDAYEYRPPIDTTLAVLRDLQGQWSSLDASAAAELGAILAALRGKLARAAGDIARGATLGPLLADLAAAASLPASSASLLAAARRPRSRSFATLDSAQAREIWSMLDRLIGPDAALTPAAMPSTSEEIFPEAHAVARRVVQRLNDQWAELSLADQNLASTWLSDFSLGLMTATDDIQRLTAAHDFLRLVKGASTIYAVAEPAFTVRGGIPSYSGPGQEFSLQHATGLIDLIGQNPLAAVPKTPWSEMAFSPPVENVTTIPPLEMIQVAPPETVNYHTDVRFPGQVRTFDSQLPLWVRLTLEKSEATVVDAGMAIEFVTPEPQQVLIVCNAEGFTVDDGEAGGTRTILVYKERDSQWAVFLLTPDATVDPGVRRISLDFYHRERLAGTASFQAEVRDRPPIDEAPVELDPIIADLAEDGSVVDRDSGGLLLASADAPRPDFVLRIALSADRRQLSYTLHSPTGLLGLVYQRMGSVRLESDPRVFMENTLLGLSQMARASKKKLTDAQFAANQARLREIGWDLYEQLFTPALRRAYRAIRQLRQQQPELSLLIVSDEPWIPWEMILPHEDDLPDEDFLCAQFRLTRWLDGRGLPEDFSLHQARVVVPKSNLASVKAEQDFFSQELPKLRPDISYGGAWLDMASQVTDALRAGDTQLFHFACHGDFDTTHPDESALKLQGDSLRPSQIVGPMRSGVAASRPLVFLNACHTGERGFSLTGMGGWAARFVRAGASAFVGSLWEVNDVLAAQFAIQFYSQLLTGHTLGDAFHTARAHIRALDEANPTWLAYTLYADPNGKVKSG
jgi:hypothetical protein